jgi:hypothetical protein
MCTLAPLFVDGPAAKCACSVWSVYLGGEQFPSGAGMCAAAIDRRLLATLKRGYNFRDQSLVEKWLKRIVKLIVANHIDPLRP